jgi:hypothetical protein
MQHGVKNTELMPNSPFGSSAAALQLLLSSMPASSGCS